MGVQYFTVDMYLNPKVCQRISPTPIVTAIKAIILHTFGVNVGMVRGCSAVKVWGLGFRV